jgi:hypothetical protein
MNSYRYPLFMTFVAYSLTMIPGVLGWTNNAHYTNATAQQGTEPNYARGEPVFDVLPVDDPNLICCHSYDAQECGYIIYGGRRACNMPNSPPFGGAPANPLGHELRVVDGCPVYIVVGDPFCGEGEYP